MSRTYTPSQIADGLLAGDFVRETEFVLAVEVKRLREALQGSACACSSIRECASEWAKDGHCPHFGAAKALEAKR